MTEPNRGSMRSIESQAGPKQFTADEANLALPLVRRILKDVVAQYRLVERIQKRRRKLSGQGRLDELHTLESQGLDAARRLSDLLAELTSIGCEVKDYERGCVDFPAVRDGREIYLCWRLNEDRVTHWHERHAGESGRQRLEP
jgi:hypothetical protein